MRELKTFLNETVLVKTNKKHKSSLDGFTVRDKNWNLYYIIPNGRNGNILTAVNINLGDDNECYIVKIDINKIKRIQTIVSMFSPYGHSSIDIYEIFKFKGNLINEDKIWDKQERFEVWKNKDNIIKFYFKINEENEDYISRIVSM